MTSTPVQRFTAPWGLPLKVISALVVVLLAGVGWAALRVPGPTPQTLIATAAILGILAAAAFMVQGYELTGDSLVVRRPGWRTVIPLIGLRSVETDPLLLRRSLRVWGNGGFFSFTGWFWNRTLGFYRVFLNDGTRAVVLRFHDRRVVVGPGDPQGFAAALRRQAGLTP